MHPGESYPGGPELADAQETALSAPDPGHPASSNDAANRPAAHRRWAAAAWACAVLVLFAFFLRISLGSKVDSDGANNALQGWDLVHGHLLLHGWMIGDATFCSFELPLLGISQLLFGIGNLAFHVSSALTYLIVAIFASVMAVTGSRGPARVIRCAVVITVLVAPLLTASSVILLLEDPDHIGTSVFLLASFLLIDRVPDRRFTAPLLCVILCAGQLSDLTVRYVAVPAIIVVCGYRVLAARRVRCGDTALAVAAAASVPLESLLRTAIVHLGGYDMVAPKTKFAPAREWPHHVVVTLANLRILFGAVVTPATRLGVVAAALGLVCLLAAAFGLGRVAWTWRTARRAEQLLGVAIACNLGVYLISVIVASTDTREIAAVLPCGAVLAARACVPERITAAPPAITARAISAIALTATALTALIPLTAAATQPTVRPTVAPLATWLEAHGLTYGVAGYWDASVVTMQSGEKVKVREADVISENRVFEPVWETNALWYDPSRYDATFVVADYRGRNSVTAWVHRLGQPAATYPVAYWVVLVYRTNLLLRLGHYSYQGFQATTDPAS